MNLSIPTKTYIFEKKKRKCFNFYKKKKPFRLLTKTKIQEKTKLNSTHIQIKPKQI